MKIELELTVAQYCILVGALEGEYDRVAANHFHACQDHNEKHYKQSSVAELSKSMEYIDNILEQLGKQ